MAWHINNRKKERTSHVRSIFFPFMPIAVCFLFHSLRSPLYLFCLFYTSQIKKFEFFARTFYGWTFFKHNLFSLCGFCAMQTMDEHFFGSDVSSLIYSLNMFCVERERKKNTEWKTKRIQLVFSWFGFLLWIFASYFWFGCVFTFSEKVRLFIDAYCSMFYIQYFFIHF